MFLWELRRTINWTWLLPLVVCAGILLWSGYIAWQDSHALAPVFTGGPYQPPRVRLPDYISPLRDTLELLMPIVCVFLATDLLLREWRQGTLMLLATRRPLAWFLAVRFGFLLTYLVLLSSAAILLSWYLTPRPPTDLSIESWLWQSLLTILAPTLLLMVLGLCVAHLVGNSIAGYVVPACCWLANWLYALQVEQEHRTSALLAYLLFGWSDQGLTPHPEAWFSGKLLLCLLAVPLLAVQFFVLRRVTLQHRVGE